MIFKHDMNKKRKIYNFIAQHKGKAKGQSKVLWEEILNTNDRGHDRKGSVTNKRGVIQNRETL